MARSNRPELDDLTPTQRIAIDDGAKALAEINDFKRLTFDKWMTVARGVAPLCELADRPNMSRTARRTFLNENGYKTLNEGTVSRLLLMAEHETAIRLWRDEPAMKRNRDRWNSPTSICNRCPAVRKVIAEANKNKPPRKPRQASQAIAFETHLDKLLDLIAAVEDADNRQAFIERVTASMTKLALAPPSDDEPTPPKTTKRKRGKADQALNQTLASATAKVGKALGKMAENIGPPGFPIRVTIKTDNE